MKKKIIALTMAACVAALVGCGATNGGSSSGSGKESNNVPAGIPDYSA